MDSVLIAVGTFVPMLLILVVVHEFGHFATARAFGVKVLEFGLGYPPRAFGIYTGKTEVRVDPETEFVNLSGVSDLRLGQLVKVSSVTDAQGRLVARTIEGKSAPARFAKGAPGEEGKGGPVASPPFEKGETGGISSGQEGHHGKAARATARLRLAGDDFLKHEGKVRAVSGDSLVLADMLYSLNLTPLGGFVRLAGENNPAVPLSLANTSASRRFVVLVAGPLMNAIFPIILFAILFMVPKDVRLGDVAIGEVVPNSPAAAAGVRPGDIVVEAGGRRIEALGDLLRAIRNNLGSEMEWRINRGGQLEIVRLVPRINPPEGQGATGVRVEMVNVTTDRQSDPPWKAVPKGFTSTWDVLVLLKEEVGNWIRGAGTPEFSGPIGIAQATGEVTEAGGFDAWLILLILFSINLAILNILPIPMLDGGRLVFVVIEWVRRGKRVPPEKEGLVHLIGFAVLIGAILLISANDINRLIQGGSVLGG